MKPSRRLSVILFLLLFVGCGPRLVPVSGLATRNGKPVTNLSILFVPANGRALWGNTDDQGRFELHAENDQKGAPLGTYTVHVNFQPRTGQEEMDIMQGKLQFHPDKDIILAKYGNKGTSQLIVEITRPNQEIHLQLD